MGSKRRDGMKKILTLGCIALLISGIKAGDIEKNEPPIPYEKDLYATLGVKKGASKVAIKTSYFNFAESMKNADSPADLAKIKEIKDAFEILSNEKLRQNYDKGQVEPAIEPTIEPTEKSTEEPIFKSIKHPSIQELINIKHPSLTIKNGVLDLSFRKIDEQVKLTSLEGLNKIPGIQNVTNLNLSLNAIQVLPTGIFDQLTKLRILDLSYNIFVKLPEGLFKNLTELRTLYLNDNMLATLPKGIFDPLQNLKKLNLSFNALKNFPYEIFDNLQNLTELNVSENGFATVINIKGLKNLKTLDLRDNPNLTILPIGIFTLKYIEKVDLDETKYPKTDIEKLKKYLKSDKSEAAPELGQPEPTQLLSPADKQKDEIEKFRKKVAQEIAQEIETKKHKPHDVSTLETARLPGYCSHFEIEFKNGIQVLARAIPRIGGCKITLPSEFKNVKAWEEAMTAKKFARYIEDDGRGTHEIKKRTDPVHYDSKDIANVLSNAIKEAENNYFRENKSDNVTKSKKYKALIEEFKKLKNSSEAGLKAQDVYDKYIELRFGGYGVPIEAPVFLK